MSEYEYYLEVARAVKEAYDTLKRHGIQVPEQVNLVFGRLPSVCGWFFSKEEQIVVSLKDAHCNPVVTLLHEIRHYQQRKAGWDFKKERHKAWIERSHETDAEYWSRENLKLVSEPFRKVLEVMRRLE